MYHLDVRVVSIEWAWVQRGAVPPLIDMLGAEDVQLKEMAAFALGRLAQNGDNQAGIVQVRRTLVSELDLILIEALPILLSRRKTKAIRRGTEFMLPHLLIGISCGKMK